MYEWEGGIILSEDVIKRGGVSFLCVGNATGDNILYKMVICKMNINFFTDEVKCFIVIIIILLFSPI